jgi:hypothetical protein
MGALLAARLRQDAFGRATRRTGARSWTTARRAAAAVGALYTGCGGCKNWVRPNVSDVQTVR